MGFFFSKKPPSLPTTPFSFSDSPWSQTSSHPFPPQHIHVFVKINPLSHQYWYNPEFLVLTYPNLFWLGVFSYNQMNIFLVSLHLVTSYPASIFGLKTPCNFIFFFINYFFLYLKLLLQSAPPYPNLQCIYPKCFITTYFLSNPNVRFTCLQMYILNVTWNHVKKTPQIIYIQHLRENSKSASAKQRDILSKRSKNVNRKPAPWWCNPSTLLIEI